MAHQKDAAAIIFDLQDVLYRYLEIYRNNPFFGIKPDKVLDSEFNSNCVCVCVRAKMRASVCWAAQSEPRVEVVFLPPMVSLGLCVCACTPGAAWGHRRGPGEPWKEGLS